MELIKEYFTKLLTALTLQYLTILRYTFAFAGVVAVFANLIRNIMSKAPFRDYIFFVVYLAIAVAMLIIFKTPLIVASVIAISGVITILDSETPTDMSGGIAFLMLSRKIGDDPLFTFILIIITILATIGNHVVKGVSSTSSFNVVIIYLAILFADFILYNYAKIEGKK